MTIQSPVICLTQFFIEFQETCNTLSSTFTQHHHILHEAAYFISICSLQVCGIRFGLRRLQHLGSTLHEANNLIYFTFQVTLSGT